MKQSSIRLISSDVAALEFLIESIPSANTLSEAIDAAIDAAARAVQNEGVDWAYVRRRLLMCNSEPSTAATTRTFTVTPAFEIVAKDLREKLALARPRVAFICRCAITYTVLSLKGSYLPTATHEGEAVSEHERLELLNRLTRLALESNETADKVFLALRGLLQEVDA